MSFEAQCPQCQFVSRQLEQPTPCLLHLALVSERDLKVAEEGGAQTLIEDYDEPYAVGQRRPTVDHPGPFTLREYVRLQLLRSRIQANPSPLDRRSPRVRAGSLSGQ